MGDKLSAELEGEPQMVLVMGDVIQIVKQRPDGWAFRTALHHADEAVSRHLIAVTVAGRSADDSLVLADTGWFSLAATRVPSEDYLAAPQKEVGDTSELAPPSYWASRVDPTIVERHDLQVGDPERTAVEDAFVSTLQPPVFKRVEVIRIERVQNLAIWQSYCVKRQTICYTTAKAIINLQPLTLWHTPRLSNASNDACFRMEPTSK